MVDYFVMALRDNPELAVFLTIAVGFFIGRLKFGNFSLGIVVGSLLAGVVIGQLDIKVPSLVKTIFFDLFLFTTGYKVGPQFFRSLKSDALPQLALTVVVCVTCLAVAYGMSKLLGYDVGTAAGLLAGAFSESTVIGTAGDAIQRLALPDAEKLALINNIPVAYAVTYLIGTAALVWYIPTVGPMLMRTNLKDEAERARTELGEGAAHAEGVLSAARPFDVRAYRVTGPALAGKTIKEFETGKNSRAFVVRVRRGDKILEPAPDMTICAGDIVAMIARHEAHASRGDLIGPEVSDIELLDLPVESLEVVVTSRAIADKSLGELAQLDLVRGVFLARLTRANVELPLWPGTRIDRGDVMRLIGRVADVERVAKEVGYPDRPTTSTNMVFVGTGIVLGGLVGLLSLSVGGLVITLTASGGALVMGLVFGWLRSVYPFFGRIPEPAVWIFDTLGLTVFIGIVGLTAGPNFVAGLKATGVSLAFIGLVSALLPHTLGILFGRYVLKMNPLMVLGACAGAGTITAALRAVQDQAQSNVPALGYTVPYAVGNILLTVWGPVLVGLMMI